jgi:hypothetical protein
VVYHGSDYSAYFIGKEVRSRSVVLVDVAITAASSKLDRTAHLGFVLYRTPNAPDR